MANGRNTKKPKRRKTISKTTKKSTKPKKKRDIAAVPGLDKTLFSKVKQEYHDIDYSSVLSSKEKKWASQFMEEYLGANLKESSLVDKYGEKAMHKSAEQRKDCFDRNNQRNRDIYSRNRAIGKLTSITDPDILTKLDELYMNESYEDELIDKLGEPETDEPRLLSFPEYLDLRDRLVPKIRKFYDIYYATDLSEYLAQNTHLLKRKK
jgi:hypothetical protein